MATLTYDPTEQAEGELTTEEKESLEVGEKLAEQQAMQQQEMSIEQGKIAASDPMNDPSKNPQLAEQLSGPTEAQPPA